MKKISIEIENSIVGMAEKGYSLRKIAEKVGVCRRKVHSTIKKEMQSKPKILKVTQDLYVILTRG